MTKTQEATVTQLATFGAGCFWGVEEAFRTLPGVIGTTVGYAGGHTKNPSYQDVCRHDTGHAEVTQVEYDPNQISYETLLEKFWSIHNPTTLNRQGPDVGSQYRSVIFTHNAEQQTAAEKSKGMMKKSGKFKNLIVTEILPAPEFYRAEECHQKYFLKNGGESCHV